MAGDDPAGKVGAERGVGDDAERMRRRVAGLVDVEVEIEPAVGGAVHHRLDQVLEVGEPCR